RAETEVQNLATRIGQSSMQAPCGNSFYFPDVQTPSVRGGLRCRGDEPTVRAHRRTFGQWRRQNLIAPESAAGIPESQPSVATGTCQLAIILGMKSDGRDILRVGAEAMGFTCPSGIPDSDHPIRATGGELT